MKSPMDTVLTKLDCECYPLFVLRCQDICIWVMLRRTTRRSCSDLSCVAKGEAGSLGNPFSIFPVFRFALGVKILKYKKSRKTLEFRSCFLLELELRVKICGLDCEGGIRHNQIEVIGFHSLRINRCSKIKTFLKGENNEKGIINTGAVGISSRFCG